MVSMLKYTAMWKFIIVSLTFLHVVSAANGCYYNSNAGVQVALAQYPCSSSGGVQVCCNIGDSCGADSICRKNADFTLPAALTSSTTRSSSAGATSSQATVIATSSTTPAVVVVPTSVTSARTTSHSASSVAALAASATGYTISSISLPLLGSTISIPNELGLIHRQSTSDDSFYVGGCTDSSYNSSECSRHCTSYALQNVVYSSSTGSWYCCGDTEADCSAPTSETFNAVAPSAFDTISPVSPAAASTIASSVLASASAASSGTSTHSKSRLSGRAAAGIAFGVAIPVIFLLAATLGICLRKRKITAHQKAHVDRALTEELAGGMRSRDSWYGGPTLLPDIPKPRSRAFGFFSHSNDSGGVDAPGHTFAYETPEGLKEVKLKAQRATARRMPLQLHLPSLHFNIGNKRGKNNLIRSPIGRLTSPLGTISSPIRTRGGRGFETVPPYLTEERTIGTGGTTTWPFAQTLQTTPWEFQRSVVSLREMDGTGINPLAQRQSGHVNVEPDSEYETEVVNTDSSASSDGTHWHVHRPWQIQKPPSLKDVDGTGKLHLPAW